MINLKQLQDIANELMDKYPNSCLTNNVRKFGHTYILEDIDALLDHVLGLFAHDILGLCGCGNPEDTWEMIRIVLDIQANSESYVERELRIKTELNLNPGSDIHNGIWQFILYILNDKGFLEHGSSIYSAWLTDLGRPYLTVLNIWHERELEEKRDD